nr:MAG TPA: hypothetical protein [Caudoviricetes sp.]
MYYIQLSFFHLLFFYYTIIVTFIQAFSKKKTNFHFFVFMT